MNLTTLVRDLCDELGLPRTSAVVASTDPQVRQILALANGEGRALASRYPWAALTHEATFTTLAAELQGTLASMTSGQAFAYIVNDTIWNRTQQRAVVGPKAPRDWQALKAASVTGPWNEYRIRNGALYFIPAPAAGETCAFEYQSASWCTDAGGATYYDRFNSDTDLILLPAECFYAGLKWRWLQRKGLEYGEAFADYERLVADAMARDGTKPVLNLASERTSAVGGLIVPEGSWPL